MAGADPTIRGNCRTNRGVSRIRWSIRFKRPLTNRRGARDGAVGTKSDREKNSDHASRGKETFHSEPQYRNAEILKS
jgi:hypothetical protein